MTEIVFVLFGLVAGSNEPYAMFALISEQDCETVADIFTENSDLETFYCLESVQSFSSTVEYD